MTKQLSFIITGFGPFGNVEENPTTVIVRRLDSYLRSRYPSSLSTSSSPSSSSSSSLNCSNLNENNENNDHELANLVHEYIIMQTSIKDVTKTMNRLRDCTIPTLIKENRKQRDNDNNNNNIEGGTSSNENQNKRKRQRIILLHLGVARTISFRLEACAYNEASFRIPDQCGYQPKQDLIVSTDKLATCYTTTINLEQVCEKLTNKYYPTILTEISTNPGRYVCNYVYCTSLQISSTLLSSLSSSSSSIPKLKTRSVNNDDDNDNNTTMDPHQYHEDNENTTHNVDNNHSTCDGGDGDGDGDGDDTVICSLFLHVPPFSITSEEEQLNYVAGLLQILEAV